MSSMSACGSRSMRVGVLSSRRPRPARSTWRPPVGRMRCWGPW
jgi:hypothetical protein